MSETFVHRLRVRYSECDQQGVVFNGQYLFYYDVAVTELMRARIGPYREIVERGFDIVVAEARLRFLNGARFDEELDIAMPIHHLGTTSMIIHPVFRVGDRMIADGEVRHVWVDPATLKKKPMSDELRLALSG
ncbi:MAG TPA: thioesterase family protein [Actinophytocola sp.]|uniref:acyl-CoA thioesterase n=1 Tax=Actinophytocola sp. TaxID=1872138 RepID=UPI002DDD0DD0|nr:thioesterase family protein [Actinophytocola sp.]HEV2783825.1 thioesterase family protein [Actinophytocola sp.]